MNPIYKGQLPPVNTDVLWVYNEEIKIFQNGGWKGISGSGGDSQNAEEFLSETSENLIENRAVYNQYMTEDDILDIPVVFDSIYRSIPLTFKIISDGNINWLATAVEGIKTIQYKKNDEEWTSLTSTVSGATIPVVAGDTVLFKGDNEGYNVKVGTSWKRTTFMGSTCDYIAEGNIMSLLSSTNFENLDSIPYDYCFLNLFRETNVTDVKNLYFPATSLVGSTCYAQMFWACTKLKNSVRFLPALSIPTSGYQAMFKNCSSLKNCPEIFAESMGTKGMSSMFEGCSSLEEAPSVLKIKAVSKSGYNLTFAYTYNLKKAPKLLMTSVENSGCTGMFGCSGIEEAPYFELESLGEKALFQMFGGCRQLKVPPILNATTLSKECYASMFQAIIHDGNVYCCENLVTAPELPAVVLAESCYERMFSACLNLKQITLPATTLAKNCYNQMFAGCESIESVELPATVLAEGCYEKMFTYITDGGVDYKCKNLKSITLPASTLVKDCYKYMFNGCNNLSNITCLATDISAQDCTYNWVTGVASKGTFIKEEDVEWTAGENGIPEGWKVIDI